ncbi:hypothetical protein NIES4074_11400 [Cylindrospermum sp. NIES-4074]|nr:hypothetical protein NIES4074_11400 [Cylindrospermum sp. NIES-4074]
MMYLIQVHTTIQPINAEAGNTVSINGQGRNRWSSLVPSIGSGTNPSAILSTVEEKALGINNGGNILVQLGIILVVQTLILTS